MREGAIALPVVLVAWGVATTATEAETIHLKSGRDVIATITKRTKDSITVDWYGVPVTYWLDEIERIEEGGSPPRSAQTVRASLSEPPATSKTTGQPHVGGLRGEPGRERPDDGRFSGADRPGTGRAGRARRMGVAWDVDHSSG